MDSSLYPLPEAEKAEGPKATSSPAASQRSSSSSSEPASSPDAAVDKFRSEKESKIRDACRWRDLDHLRSLATTEDGFLYDKLRHLAWPILLGCGCRDGDENVQFERSNEGDKMAEKGTRDNMTDTISPPWKELPPHPDEDQVRLDVDRSFVYYPIDISESGLEVEKAALAELITEVLRRHPHLSYFQGYHDICQVFLLALPRPERYKAVSRLSVLRIRDFMLPALAPSLKQLRLIPELLSRADPQLAHHLGILPPSILKPPGPLSFLAALARNNESDEGLIHLAAMQGTLTMYAHDIESYSGIARLFDALLAYEPVFSLYVFVQMVISRRRDILETEPDDPDLLQFTLQKLPQHHELDLDQIVEEASKLYCRVPPSRLKGWRAISEFSVLKTGRALQIQSEAYGRACFDAQVREMRQEERRKKVLKRLEKYRKPVGRAFGLAMLVGIVAILLKRDSGTVGWLMSLVGRQK